MLDIYINIDTGNTLAKLDEILKNIDSSITIVEYDTDEMIEYIVRLAKIYCPVGTGNLRESIRVEGSFPSYILLADATDKYGEQYAKFVEYGSSLQQAQAFMWPAIEDVMAVYIPKIRRDFRAAIKGEG